MEDLAYKIHVLEVLSSSLMVLAEDVTHLRSMIQYLKNVYLQTVKVVRCPSQMALVYHARTTSCRCKGFAEGPIAKPLKDSINLESAWPVLLTNNL
jgi:hypothetical protein